MWRTSYKCKWQGVWRRARCALYRYSYQETYLSSIHAAEEPRYNNRNHLDAGAMPAAIRNSVSQILCWHTLLDFPVELPKRNCRRPDPWDRHCGRLHLLKWAYFGDYQNPPHIDLRSLRELRTRYLTVRKNDPCPAIMPDIMGTFIV